MHDGVASFERVPKRIDVADISQAPIRVVLQRLPVTNDRTGFHGGRAEAAKEMAAHEPARAEQCDLHPGDSNTRVLDLLLLSGSRMRSSR